MVEEFDSTCTSAGLLVSQQARKIACIFCQDKHCPVKCQALTDSLIKRKFLKISGKCFLCLKDNHQFKNCKKYKPSYYCKGLHNSAIYFKKDKTGDPPNLPDKSKQDEKTESIENSPGCSMQSFVCYAPNSCRCCLKSKRFKVIKDKGFIC